MRKTHICTNLKVSSAPSSRLKIKLYSQFLKHFLKIALQEVLSIAYTKLSQGVKESTLDQVEMSGRDLRSPYWNQPPLRPLNVGCIALCHSPRGISSLLITSDPGQTVNDWQGHIEELILARQHSIVPHSKSTEGDLERPTSLPTPNSFRGPHLNHIYSHQLLKPIVVTKSAWPQLPDPIHAGSPDQSLSIRPISAASKPLERGENGTVETKLSTMHRNEAAYSNPDNTRPGTSNSSLLSTNDSIYTSTEDPQDEPSDNPHNRYADADDLSVAIGQLSIDDDNYVSYHGRSTGLHLLANAVEQVDTRNNTQAGGFNADTAFRVSNPLGYIPTQTSSVADISPTDCITGLPPLAEQEYLLRLYFVHAHPENPVVHAGDIMRSFRHMSVLILRLGYERALSS